MRPRTLAMLIVVSASSATVVAAEPLPNVAPGVAADTIIRRGAKERTADAATPDTLIPVGGGKDMFQLPPADLPIAFTESAPGDMEFALPPGTIAGTSDELFRSFVVNDFNWAGLGAGLAALGAAALLARGDGDGDALPEEEEGGGVVTPPPVVPVTPIPEPATVVLLGSGLALFCMVHRRRLRAAPGAGTRS